MKGQILIVDDDAAMLEVLEMRLQAMGFDVTAAKSAHDALATAGARGFDAALFDLRMEPIDGITLMEEVHRTQPRLPVLIMTAHGTIETAVQAVQRGAFDYLTKPFVRDELRTKLLRALSERRWARDRERLRAVGDVLASSGVMDRILGAVAQAAVETSEAERCVVFLLEKSELIPMAIAGASRRPVEPLREAAARASETRALTTLAGADGRITLAAPLVVDGESAGALVIEAPARVEPTHDDLELLALFSSQAAVAIKNTHELSRLRSGALAALGRMAAQVAHELKNPLGGLKLYARLLEQRLVAAGDTDGREIAVKIGKAIDHLAELVTEITAYGRSPELRRVPTDLTALLNDCLALAQDRVADRKIQIVLDYDRGCPRTMLDERALRKVFLNLILNGLEAIAAEGVLTIRSRFDGDRIEVAIEDTGCGMTQETQSRIFDLFFTTKPNGTGLGMGIARAVVDRHGGRMTVDSAPGQGTRVRVQLPALPVAADAPLPGPAAS
jgi:signal transduction histidine kinase